jgi:Ca2+-binding RTX toxin-like protein
VFVGELPEGRGRDDFDHHDRGHDRHDRGPRGDSYDGGAGVDTLDFSASGRAVDFDLADGITRFGASTVVGVENLIGSSKGDKLAGNAVANELRGNDGDDKLVGEKGDDRLFGGDGRDELDGGKGHDVLVGGTGKDTLTGGEDIDWFVFNHIEDGKDTIRDFDIRGADKDLIVLADTIFSNFTGDDGADLVAGGFLRARTSHGKTEIQVDTDGGGDSWQTIAEISEQLSTAGLSTQVMVNQGLIV